MSDGTAAGGIAKTAKSLILLTHRPTNLYAKWAFNVRPHQKTDISKFLFRTDHIFTKNRAKYARTTHKKAGESRMIMELRRAAGLAAGVEVSAPSTVSLLATRPPGPGPCYLCVRVVFRDRVVLQA